MLQSITTTTIKTSFSQYISYFIQYRNHNKKEKAKKYRLKYTKTNEYYIFIIIYKSI